LKFGIAKADVLPTSDVTVFERAARASSAWFEGVIDVGSDTSRYLEPFDMAAAVQRASESEEGAECVKLLLWSMQSWWAVKLRREADAR
jgi:hypothetical protein